MIMNNSNSIVQCFFFRVDTYVAYIYLFFFTVYTLDCDLTLLWLSIYWNDLYSFKNIYSNSSFVIPSIGGDKSDFFSDNK